MKTTESPPGNGVAQTPPGEGPRPSPGIAYRNLPLLFMQAREGLVCHFRPILNHFGLTEQQWRIMRALVERGAMEPCAMVKECQILSPSLAGVLARMDETGMVIRSRVPTDQRRVMVSLSPRGIALFNQMAPLIEAQYEKLQAALGPALMEEMYAVLDKVIAAQAQAVERVCLPMADPERPPVQED